MSEITIQYDSLINELKEVKNINEQEFTNNLVEFASRMPFTVNEILSDCVWLAKANKPMPWEMKNVR